MTKLTMMLLFSGVAISFCLAVWQYYLAPQGMLLYTPAPGIEPHYTPTSSVGFFVGVLALSAIGALVAILSFIGGAVFNRKLFAVVK